LYNSPYGSPEKIDLITVCFDKLTKSAFKDATASAFIVFGSERDNDPSVNIELGQLKLPGSVNSCSHAKHLLILHRTDVASFFAPCITVIEDAVRAQRAAANAPISVSFSVPPSFMAPHDAKYVMLVGRFAMNQWLFASLQTQLQVEGLNVCRPDCYLWAFYPTLTPRADV
jgi:hypothetical protein